MSRLVFFLEEPSARNFLLGFLPALGFQSWEFKCRRPYEGKQDLLKSFAADLREWEVPGDRFLVLVDQDRDDCRVLKRDGVLAEAREKCRAQSERLRARIVCRELEAWYLGDLGVLRRAYPATRAAAWREIRRLGNPDALNKPSDILKRAVPGFHKPLAAQAMGELLGRKCAGAADYYDSSSAACNSSPSFRCFAATMADALRELREERASA